MMRTYFGILRKDVGTDFGVDFPDFPGCVSAGNSAEEAMSLGQEALNFHIRGMLEDGDAIPPPSTVEAILADPAHQGGVLFLARSFHRPKGKAVRTNVTIEEGLLAEIDAYIAPRKLSRSAFLASAAEKALASGS
jgi:predicted RNase H-like HicB family nuclease